MSARKTKAGLNCCHLPYDSSIEGREVLFHLWMQTQADVCPCEHLQKEEGGLGFEIL